MYLVTTSASRRSRVTRGVFDSKNVRKLIERGLVRASARVLKARRNCLIYSRSLRQIFKDTIVRRCYMSVKISSERTVVKFRGKRPICMSMLQAYILFKVEFTGVKVPHRSFIRLRP